MAYEILMPQLGLTMEEGAVSRWMKHEGDAVKAGDVVAEITTDKLTHELQSERDGVLLKIVAQEGDDVPVKGILAYIGEAGERVTAAPAAAPAASAADPKRVIVVGGGPGGYVAAIRAAQLGAKVTLIEREHLGVIIAHQNLRMLAQHLSGCLEDQVVDRVLPAGFRQQKFPELH